MNKLRIALIGAGDCGAIGHMPSFAENPKVEVVAVADTDTQAAQALVEKYRVARVVEDYRELLDDSAINAFDICVPHDLHYPITMDALNAGKHVILDKPIAMNLEEADRMISAAHELGLRLLVVLNQRFLPAHRAIKEMIDDGRMGKPFLMNAILAGDVLARMNDPYDWKGTRDRSGGGAFFDTGTHIVDLMHYWFGLPTAVSATVKRLVVTSDNKADDNASVTFEFDESMIANLIVSYTMDNEPWSEKKFIYGTRGNIAMISEAIVPMFYVSNNVPEMVEVEHQADWWTWSIDRALRHFVDCILEGDEPLVTAEDARAALHTILAAYDSAREGKRTEIT